MFSDRERRLCLSLVILFAVNILVIAAAQTVDAATYKKGSSGQKAAWTGCSAAVRKKP